MMQKPKVVVFVQARMGSTRLPEKVLRKVNGRELLGYMIQRINQAKTVDKVVVISSLGKENDAIEAFCDSNHIACYRGSENDLLDRHYQAAKIFGADFVVKIPSDSPLTDPKLIDEVLSLWIHHPTKYDYVSNYHPPTFPDGLDVEGCPIAVLEEAWLNAKKPHEREHTFPYIWDNPSQFRIGNITNPLGDMFISHRWTLDYEEDFQFIQRVFHEFGYENYFSFEDILQLLKEKPEIASLNSKHAGINWYRNIQGELNTVSRFQYKTNTELKLDRSLALLEQARQVIPCATQTLSKGYTQWSVGAVPLFIDSASGCEVTDVDGNVYIDYAMALGPFILGYSDPDINKAVEAQLKKGTMFTLPHPLETEVARKIIDTVPCAEMVRFGKNGSDATSAAVKVARAYTGKDKILVCGYHGWQDWYVASTERDAGIPKVMKDLVVAIPYNNLPALEQAIAQHAGQVAGLIMEPMGAVIPSEGYLKSVREITQKHGLVLIFDELFTGFRWSLGGAQEYFGMTPDLACYGKALANGFPISAIAGRRDIMEMFEKVFFSFTYGGEALSLAAASATIDKLKECKVHEFIVRQGTRLMNGVETLIQKHELISQVSITGLPFKSVFNFVGTSEATPLEIKTYMQQECAQRGVLFVGYHLPSYSHSDSHIDYTVGVYDEVLGNLKKVLENKTLKSSLKGEVVTQIFKNVGDRSAR